MNSERIPSWMQDLEEEDVKFIKKFILNSGSLKEMANEYEVTYPTVRLRLDRLIQKIELKEKAEDNSYVSLIKNYAVDDKIDFDVAKVLINEFRKKIESEEI